MHSTRRLLGICGAALAGCAVIGANNHLYFLSEESDKLPSSVVRCASVAEKEDNTVTTRHSLNHNSSRRSHLRRNAVFDQRYKPAISRSRKLVRRLMIEQGVPGAVVAVSKNGEVVWSEGMGYSDVENEVQCTSDTVMRIASISKPVTTVALLQLWEKGLVDLDAPIQTYVAKFPKKYFDGKEVDVTTRQLLSHMGGVRHYKKKSELNNDDKTKGEGEKKEKGTFDHMVGFKEYYITKHYDSLEESMELFAGDELLSEPGTKFNYTTHGWTLVSAVIEKASGMEFLPYLQKHVFNLLGMAATVGEFHEPLVFNRSRHYVRSDNGLLLNTPYVDLSYKWAGGGLISSAKDLIKLGNALLTSYQQQMSQHNTNRDISSPNSSPKTRTDLSKDTVSPHCILDPSTVAMMWNPVVCPNEKEPHLSYGMGWYVTRDGGGEIVGGKRRFFSAAHTGAAIGASSVLVIMSDSDNRNEVSEIKSVNFDLKGRDLPDGVVVAVILNLQEVKNVYQLGIKIAEEFM